MPEAKGVFSIERVAGTEADFKRLVDPGVPLCSFVR